MISVVASQYPKVRTLCRTKANGKKPLIIKT
jgi:hypothetical protein